jgi:hypothetical protein
MVALSGLPLRESCAERGLGDYSTRQRMIRMPPIVWIRAENELRSCGTNHTNEAVSGLVIVAEFAIR